MEDEQIQAMYDRLALMTVTLEHDASLGPDYLREKLLEARAFQNEASDHVVAINRFLSEARLRMRTLQVAVKMADPGSVAADKIALVDISDRAYRLALVKEAAQVRRQNLTRVAADVRLLLGCMKIGLMTGGGSDQPVQARPAQVLPSDVTPPPVDMATAGFDALEDFYAQPPVVAVETISLDSETVSSNGETADPFEGLYGSAAVEVEEEEPPL